MIPVSHVFADILRVLSFRKPSMHIATSAHAYLLVGLILTWLAGVGRYWDSPRAGLWQYFGLGSLAYVFVLAAIIWLLLIPLRPKRWSYGLVLLFITLTSPPALLYAIPVERFLSLEAAERANVCFLAVVALWRVALLAWFLRTVAGLSAASVVVATLLPLTIILFALTCLNLEHVVFSLMAGIGPEDRSANDAAYFVVVTLTVFSMLALPVLLLGYAWLAYRAHARERP